MNRPGTEGPAAPTEDQAEALVELVDDEPPVEPLPELDEDFESEDEDEDEDDFDPESDDFESEDDFDPESEDESDFDDEDSLDELLPEPFWPARLSVR